MNRQDMSEEKALLVGNRLWFNGFFQDLYSLLEQMYRKVEKKDGATWRGYYYEKSNSIPAIPGYLLMGLSNDKETLQIYVVLQPDILKREFFKKEVSFVVIRLSQPGLALSVSECGWRVLSQDNRVTIPQTTPHISGQLPNGVYFHAFQMALDPFISAMDAEAVIDGELIQKLAQLPDFQTDDNP